jgi:MFS family permease
MATPPVIKDPARKVGALALFREGPFRLIFAIKFSSNTANQMLGVVVGWQVYDLTGSAFDLGMIGLVQFLPPLALTLYAGQVADRYDRRIVLRFCYAVQIFMPIGLLVLTNVESPPLIAFYALLLIGALSRTFEGPTLQALLPSMVGRDALAQAIALSTSAQKMSSLLGPSLGGLIYIIGPSVDYAVCMVLIAIAAVASFMLPAPQFSERDPRNRDWGTVFSGLRMIRDNPILLGLMTLDLLAVFFGGVVALLPIFAKDILGIGPVGLGLLRSSPAVGALLMAVVMARFPVKRAAGRMIFAGVAVYGVATIIFGLSSSVVLSVVCMLALGAGDMLSQVLRQTIIQIRIPDEMRGRVAAVSSLSVNVGGQLGMFESGVTAAWFGAVGSVLFGGVAVLAIVVIWMWRFPTLRDIETPEEGQPPAPSSGKGTG